MNILIATDGSPSAMACVETLKTRSCADDTSIHLISVFDPHDYYPFGHSFTETEAQMAVNVAIERLKDCSYRKSSEIVAGSPSQKILDAAKRLQPDMLFIGAHSPPTWHKPFLGGVAQTILQRSDFAVTIIRTAIDGNYKPEKKYLICIDSTAGDTDSWIFRKTHVWPASAEFLVLNVVEPPIEHGSENPRIDAKMFLEALNNKRKQMTQLIENEVAYIKGLFPNALISGQAIESLDVVEAILRFAKSWQADLIVMNPHLHKGIDKFLVGSVSQEVAKRAYCSVEIVR